jgi:hypothetical protein
MFARHSNMHINVHNAGVSDIMMFCIELLCCWYVCKDVGSIVQCFHMVYFFIGKKILMVYLVVVDLSVYVKLSIHIPFILSFNCTHILRS